MKINRALIKILVFFLVLLASDKIFAQQDEFDFSVRISETDLNGLMAGLKEARAINFGGYPNSITYCKIYMSKSHL